MSTDLTDDQIEMRDDPTIGQPVLDTEQYVDADGMACPGCGDTRFVQYSKGQTPVFFPLQASVTVRVECTECKATWTDEYALTGYSNFSNEPVQTEGVTTMASQPVFCELCGDERLEEDLNEDGRCPPCEEREEKNENGI